MFRKNYNHSASRAKKVSEAQWIDKFKKIREHSETIILKYEDLKPVYDFIVDRFPSVKESVLNIQIYKNHNTYFCNKIIGIPKEAGGVFVRCAKSILLCYCKEFPEDIIACHELLHFVSSIIGSACNNQDYEEDFAFAHSIPYLKARGCPDDWIIKKYLLPWFATSELNKKKAINPDITKEDIEEAKKKGEQRARRWVFGGGDFDFEKKAKDDSDKEFSVFDVI